MSVIERRNLSTRQVDVQRKNLLNICRLTVKNLIDKSSIDNIDDDNEDLLNFFAVIEHILDHRLRCQKNWFGAEEDKYYWDFIKATCKVVRNSCIPNIDSIENIRTPWAKGRAWLRCALMEKRLSEYLGAAMKQTKLTRKFYESGAMMVSEEATELCGIIVGLNSIDFSFCLKGENLEMNRLMAINYSPYLVFQQSLETAMMDEEELRNLNNLNVSSSIMIETSDESATWEMKYKQMETKYRIALEQKGYLEELVGLRDSQLAELQRQFQTVAYNLQHYEMEKNKERAQFESIILELQEQLTSQKSLNRKLQQRVDMANAVRYGHHGPIREMEPFSPKLTIENDERPMDYQDERDGSDPARLKDQSDAGSLQSTRLSSKTEDTQSLIPLVGSLISESEQTQRNRSNRSDRESMEMHDVDTERLGSKSSSTSNVENDDAFVTIETEDTAGFLEEADSRGNATKEISRSSADACNTEKEISQTSADACNTENKLNDRSLPEITRSTTSTAAEGNVSVPTVTEDCDKGDNSNDETVAAAGEADDGKLMVLSDISLSSDENRQTDRSSDGMEIVGHSDITSGESDDWNLLSEGSDDGGSKNEAQKENSDQ